MPVHVTGGSNSYVAYSRDLSHPMVTHGAIALVVLARAEYVKQGAFMVEDVGNKDTVAAGVKVGGKGEEARNRVICTPIVEAHGCHLNWLLALP